MDNYVIFHLHSMLSNGVTNIDSITGYQDYVDQAKAWGMKAMAFSEHGSVFEYLKKKEAVEKAGMKYIHAMEAYVTETVEEKIRDNYHCVLIAKNYEGFLELNRLSSKAFNRSEVKASGDTTQYYYQPRISFDDLLGTSDNIIISTACLASILNNAPDEMRERFICFLAKNKHRCFLEIQHHNVEEQKEYNKYLLTLSDSINVPLIAGTDTHALNDAHMEGRAILQRSKNVHFDNEDKWDLTMKNRADLETAYALQGALPKEVYEEAIDNTNFMADMVEEFALDHDYKYPHLWDDSMGTFRRKIEDGIKWRGVDKYENYQEYLDRIEHEIKAYEHNGAIDFMLLMEDIISWCRSQDIMVGYGRGSVNGSVIAWLLGITEMDSIKYKLNFERFMNIERVSLSDIDTDFPPSRIDDVKQYIFAKHGLYCSDIITFNTIADKGAIKDVARALSLPLSEAQEIADSVDNEQKYAESRKKYPELFKYVDLVKGVVVSIGSHPCGTIVSPETLDDHVGLCTTSTSKYPISQLYMKEIDSLNYVKLDLLKLDTIELIDKTCKLAGIPRITPDNIDVDDVKVWNAIRDDTTQIFQWEGTTGDKYIKKLLADENIKKYQAVNENVDRMTLLSIGNSAIRPAGASYREDLANGIVRKTGSKPIDDFLSNTFGYLVFQCQIIDFLHLYCGFTMGEADVVRRCVDEDTLVTMFNGNQKRIKDVCVGDRVVSYNENGFSEVCDVNNVFDNGEKECVEISLKHGNSIVCTADHKVLTQDGYKTAGSLRCDDFVMTPSRIITGDDGLRPNQRLSASTMFMIGLLLGDGCIYNGNMHYVNHELVLVERYKECINNLLRNKTECEFIISENKGVTVDCVYTVKIKSKNYKNSLSNLLDKYDMKHDSANKYIPDQFMSYPKGEKLTSLIAGLFNSDGGYNNGTVTIEYSSISNMLVIQLKYLLLKYGIYSYISKSYVKDYDYYTYVLHICQKSSIETFGREILPFIIGVKRDAYAHIIELSVNKDFNYYLPQKYRDEIINSCASYNRSVRELASDSCMDIAIKKEYDLITDKKAQYFSERVYCPETYKILASDYQPVKVTKVQSVGIRHVYDIEVDKNHNYIANNLIVHNCFAKKLGTEQCIPVIKDGGYITENSKHYIPGYIETMEKKYGISRDKSEQDIVAFIKVIEDASSYLFSLNHSQPYSLEGYASGWLRTYYPLEFLTVAMNINADNEEKTSALTQYAKKVGITFHSPKFRHSRGDYFCDKNDNAIYKGIESIKFMNETVSAELVRLGKNQYTDFVDLLYDLADTTINSRQLDILIKIDFFSEFGDINTLLWIVQEFNLLYGKKSIKKDSSFVATIGEDVIRQFSDSETPTHIDEINHIDFFRYREVKDVEEALSDCQKFRYETADDGTRKKIANGISYTKLFKKYEITEEEKKYFATKTVYGRFEGIHTKSLLKHLLRNSKYPPCKIGQKIRYEEELLGYINYKDPRLNKRVIAVTKLNTEWSPKFTAYCLNNGKTCELKIHKKRNPKDKRVKIAFHDLPIHNGDILLAKSFVQEPKRRKNAYGNWENVPDVYEWWLNDY